MRPSPRGWLLRSGRLLSLGIQMELRSPRLRFALLAAAAFGAVIGAANVHLAGATSVWLSSQLGPLLGMLACLGFGASACRHLDDPSRTLLQARAVDGGYLAGILWATVACIWLLGISLIFLAAALVQAPFSGPIAIPVHLAALARTALTVGSMGTLSFAVSRMLRSPAGGVLVAAAWGILHLSSGPLQAFQPEYSQNGPLLAGMALFTLGGVTLILERHRRGELRQPAVPAAVLIALLVASGAMAARIRPQGSPTEEGHRGAMSGQTLEVMRSIPGFWLSDGRGGTVRTADHPGKVLLIYLFRAEDLSGCRALAALEQLRKENAPGDLQPLGICVARSQGDAWTLAALGGTRFPIGIDPAVPGAGAGSATALTRAYQSRTLPMLVITDRRHRARVILSGPPPDLAALRRLVAERLQEEPAAGESGGVQ